MPADADDPSKKKRRRRKTLSAYVEVATESTVNNAIDNFIDQQYINSPRIVYETEDGEHHLIMNGQWTVDTIGIEDHLNGVSTVSVSAFQFTDYVEFTETTPA